MTRDALITVVASAVTLMWLIAGIASVITHDATSFAIANSVLVIIVSGGVAVLFRRNGNGKNGAH